VESLEGNFKAGGAEVLVIVKIFVFLFSTGLVGEDAVGEEEGIGESLVLQRLSETDVTQS
jgi:hypothetical protein